MKKSLLLYFVSLLSLSLLFSAACSTTSPRTMTLATTTSTADSGLLNYILPPFEKESNVAVKVVAVGTGQAIQLGEKGDADVLLVHDPSREEKFVADGYGVNRRHVMYNDFIIVGPQNDPARIKGMASASEAFIKIAETENVIFVSRGDDSGTHAKEKSIWQAAGIAPAPQNQNYQWIDASKTPELKGRYESLGQGMGETLNTANEKLAYTLADRGTYLAQTGLELIVLIEGDEKLFNPYGVIAVNPQKYAHVKYDLSMKFINYLCAYETQQKIGEFGKDKYGAPLFFPNSKQWQALKKK